VTTARRTRRITAPDLPVVREDVPPPKVRCYRLEKGEELVHLPDAEPVATWVGDGTVRWVDVQTPDPEAFRRCLERLNVPPRLIERAVEFDERITDAHAEREAAWLRIPVPAAVSEEEHRFINVVALPNVLVTHHRRPMARLESLEDLLLFALPEGTGTIGLILEVLEEFAREDLRLYVRTRHEVDRLARQLDDDSMQVRLDDIAELMRRVDLLSTVCEDHLLAVSLLPQLETQAFRTSGDRAHAREVTATFERYQFGLKRLERRLESLRSLYLTALQERANQRLRLLTVMSTMFLPLTLLASIYGMNFEFMPELHSPYGYPAVIAAMLVIAGGQVWFYRRRGWFD
jgi:magnesium transporter